jgi:hypothetical protein
MYTNPKLASDGYCPLEAPLEVGTSVRQWPPGGQKTNRHRGGPGPKGREEDTPRH